MSHGKFLFYDGAIDNTILHAINDIASRENLASTYATTKYFLNYAASNPDAEVIYQASDMILHVDSDTAYLVQPKIRSCAGGYHYLGNNARTQFNGPILVLAKSSRMSWHWSPKLKSAHYT